MTTQPLQLAEHDFSLHSGERIPNLAEDDIHPDHWARYRYAVEHLRDLPGPLVGADVFCGSGYGSFLLARELPCFLIGIDGSAEAVLAAGRHHAAMNLLFAHKLFPFALPPAHFDFIVSLESIEHVADGAMLFEMFARALKPGGRLVVSAPNADRFDLVLNPYPWHHRHYTPDDLLGLGACCGLRSITWAGADCIVMGPDGRRVTYNFFTVADAQLRTHYAGGTITHVFERPR